jgi:HEAT repeat protein
MATPKGRYLLALFVVIICGGLLARVLRARAENGMFNWMTETRQPPDSALARAFLAGVRGAAPLMCELAGRGMDNRWGDGMPDVAGELGSDTDTHEVMLWAMRDVNSAEPVPILRAGLSDADPCVRTMSARLLGRTRDPAALAALIPALRDQIAETRSAAALGLGYAESPRAIEPLSLALKDADAHVRASAAFALGKIENPTAVTSLGTALQDVSASVRATAAWALGQIEDHRSVPALGTLLVDSDTGVRRNAAWALGRIEDARAIGPLTSALEHDSDATVRRAAAWALGNIK